MWLLQGVGRNWGVALHFTYTCCNLIRRLVVIVSLCTDLADSMCPGTLKASQATL